MIIPNGVNGNYSADNEEYMDISDNSSKNVSKEFVTEDEEGEEEEGDDEEDGDDEDERAVESQERQNEDSEQNEAVGNYSKEGETFDSKNDFKVSKLSDGVSETNNSSEVSKTESECKNTSCEAMEVDEQSNNSDVECLDESITEIQLDDVFISKKNYRKARQ